MNFLAPTRAMILILLLIFSGMAWAGTEDCVDSPVFALDAAQATSGHGKLCITPNGVHGIQQLRGLNAGDAYTTWIIYFDDPTQCEFGPENCGSETDFFGDDPVAVLTRFDSGIAPRNGHLAMKGAVNGMQPSSGSLWWYFTLDHGAANYSDGRDLARQLMTPEDPIFGSPHLGVESLGVGFEEFTAIAIFVTP